MAVSMRLVPIKLHYFFFMGSVAPILPFLMVVGVQLGVPVQVQGVINALVLVLVLAFKPLIAAAADAFQPLRKVIFIILLTLMVTCFSAIWLIKPFTTAAEQHQSNITLHGRLISNKSSPPTGGPTAGESHLLFLNASSSDVALSRVDDNLLFIVPYNGDTAAAILRAPCCVAHCDVTQKTRCFTVALAQATKLGGSSGLLRPSSGGASAAVLVYSTTAEYTAPPFNTKIRLTCNSASSQRNSSVMASLLSSAVTVTDHYFSDEDWNNTAHIYNTSGCSQVLVASESVMQDSGFYVFCLLMLAAIVSFSTTNSITDAVCMDTIGPTGDYGAQRAWGSVGWGLVGLLSGLLVDWWSTDPNKKDYSPAFVLVLVLGAADLVVSAISLKVPKIDKPPSIWKDVAPLFRKPRFVFFLLFVILNGCLGGIVANFIFVFQEEIAAGTPAMHHIKLIQGLTLVVQSTAEVPFMFLCDRLSKRYGAERLMTAVFAAYALRISFLSLMGYMGNVWLTLVSEVLTGPCYGLGYTAIVLYAGQLAAPGTSATVQSVVNICYEAMGFALSSAVGGLLIQSLGGAATYMLFGALAAATCVLHWVFTRVYPAPVTMQDVAAPNQPISGAIVEPEAEDTRQNNPNKDNNTAETEHMLPPGHSEGKSERDAVSQHQN